MPKTTILYLKCYKLQVKTVTEISKNNKAGKIKNRLLEPALNTN